MKSLRPLLLATCFLTLSANLLAAPVYHVTYLGFNFTNGILAKLNNTGQIVGNSSSGGFVYKNGQFITLPTLGGSGSSPTAINSAGAIAGSSSTASLGTHAFRYLNGSITDLDALPNYPKSAASGINDAGDVVGGSFNNSGTQSHAFLYHNGALTDLGSGNANAINSSGDIIGTSEAHRAVRYQNGMVIDLGNFGDSDLTSAVDINNAGLIAGTSFVQLPNNSFVNHPFLYESGVWHDLGLPAGVPLGIPSAINNLGHIVGNSNQSLGASDRPPFVYTDGAIYNLQSLLDSSGSGLNLQLAYDINDSGVILAQGQNGAGYQAVLLTPVPEPSAVYLASVGAILAGFCLGHRNSRTLS